LACSEYQETALILDKKVSKRESSKDISGKTRAFPVGCPKKKA
jgi:hypothetical protein